MRRIIAIATMLCSAAAIAEVDGFDQAALGSLPAGWHCGATGGGSPTWAVESDSTAPSKPNVLKQSGQGTFPWCARTEAVLTDGFIEVKFKPVAGREDQAGGVLWRFKDGDNYYVARANALENNVSLYYTVQGRRHTIRYVNAPVAANQWHKLRVVFAGTQIHVYLDDKEYLNERDNRISGAGSVGVWTKADSVTEFDDVTWGVK